MSENYKCQECGEKDNIHFNYDYSKKNMPIQGFLCNECGYYIELKNYKTQKDMEKEENIDGFLNRHEVKLPIDKCLIEIIVNENPPQTEKCEWLPAEKNNPSKDFIGTAVRIRNPKIGYNAWRQNDTEFVFYRIID